MELIYNFTNPSTLDMFTIDNANLYCKTYGESLISDGQAKTTIHETVPVGYFNMLIEKLSTLTIKCISDDYIILSIKEYTDDAGYYAPPGLKEIKIRSINKEISICYVNCQSVAEQCYIKNYKLALFSFDQDNMLFTNFTNFPFIDENVKNLTLWLNTKIDESCTYFNNLPFLESLTITSHLTAHFVDNVDINCTLNNLSFTLIKLEINCKNLKYPIESMPSSLECFIVKCNSYNFPIDYPQNLKHFELDCNDYSYGIENLPDSVVFIGISYNNVKELPPKLPKKCKYLLYNNCPNELYTELTKRKLKVLLLKHRKKQMFPRENANIYMYKHLDPQNAIYIY
uniref:Uncharacterized protein n=1 Tax=viral metagenome TaxID=1070528 RepID=A0A6C0HLJ2_9ZZZZ